MSFAVRAYQDEAVDAVLHRWGDGDRGTLLHMATGTGKTRCMSKIAKYNYDEGGRTLFIAHLGELLDDGSGGGALNAFKRDMPHARYCFEQNTETVQPIDIAAGWPDVVFSMVQSLTSADRFKKYPEDFFDVIMIDEAHRAAAKSYLRIVEHFPHARLLLVTATPERADGKSIRGYISKKKEKDGAAASKKLRALAESVAYTYDITHSIRDGWLVTPIPRSVKAVHIDFSHLADKRGDYTDEEVEKATNNDKALHEIAVGLRAEAPDMSTIVFMPGVESAHNLAKIMRDSYGEAVEAIDGTTDKTLRKDIVARYKSGQLLRLINVGCFTQGFDATITKCVAICRPTKSEGLYLQMLGRGTRPYPDGVVDNLPDAAARLAAIAASVKPHVLLIDFEGNIGTTFRRPIRCRDVLIGKLPHLDYGGQPEPSDEDVRRVDERHPEMTIDELRQRASDERYMYEVLSGKRFGVAAKLSTIEVQEFKDFWSIPVTLKSEKPTAETPKEVMPGDEATVKQRKFIAALNRDVYGRWPDWDWLDGLSKKEAGGVIKTLLDKQKAMKQKATA